MATTFRLKRRAAPGSAGAPNALKTTELAFNENDNTMYLGKGDDGSGNATSIIAVAGNGAFADLSTNQTVGGVKTFSSSPVVPTPTTDMQASTKKYVDDKFGTPPAHTHAESDITNLTTDLSAKAPLANPTFTGVPAAPTANAGTNTTQIATTAFVTGAISDLIGAAPSALNTLQELGDALGDDANFASTMTTALGARLVIANNLSDLNNAGTARTNLGLGSLATQAANNVSISGGSIDGVILDGGTF